jgi:AcrR family transcriptional regulator
MAQPERRRQYNSPLRRQQSDETRRRILTAGLQLLQVPRALNWPAVTIRDVASQAGVNERTVYRYFGSERELRDAVLDLVHAESGVDLAALRLADVAATSRQVLEYFAAVPPAPASADADETVRDATFAQAAKRKRAALLRAIEPETAQWKEQDRVVAAALLDLLWNVRSYQQLRQDWDLEPAAAIGGLTWLIGLLEAAIRDGRPPR